MTEGSHPVQHWLDHPDVQAIVPYFNEIVSESDRGAVLITAEIVNQALEKRIAGDLPEFLNTKKQKSELLSFNGLLGTFSSRIRFAALKGWIGEVPFNAVDALRKLRNDAAHVDSPFVLNDDRSKALLTRFLETGTGVAVTIHNINVEILLMDYLETLRTRGAELQADLGHNPFETNAMIYEVLKRQPDWQRPLEQRIPKLNLAIGAYLFVALLNAGPK